MSTCKKILLLISLFLPMAGFSAESFLLVDNGAALCRIAANAKATAPEFRAFTELENYIHKITGTRIKRATRPGVILRVFSKENPETVEIMPITLEHGRLMLPEKVISRLETAKPDAFYIFSEIGVYGKRIFIAGKTANAVLYGTNAFIEDYLGVRWFHAGAEGEYCPKSKTLSVPAPIDDFREPWCDKRHDNCWHGSIKPWNMQDMEVWLTRRAFHWNINHNYDNLPRERLDHAWTGNTFQGYGGHLVLELSVPKYLFESHPEYFPMQDGKRVCQERSQRCLTNPEVQRLVIQFATTITQYYNTGWRMGFHDSTDGWCHCPDCVAWGTVNGKFSLSNLAHKFTELITREVLRRNPQATLTYDIYSQYREVPDFKPEYDQEQVSGTYCPHQRCYVHALNDPTAECNRKFNELLLDWLKISKKIGIFDYYAYAQAPYCPLEYTLAKDMKYYRDLNLSHWIEDNTNKNLPIPLSNWQFYYVASKLLWNADLDVEKILDDAYTRYYGKAEQVMKKYHQYRRELWEAAPGHCAYGGPKRYGYCLTVAGAEKRLVGFLEEAEKLAQGDAILQQRIANDRKFLTEFWIAEANKIQQYMSSQNNIPASRIHSPITIDGVLDEEAWKAAAFVSGFKVLKTNADPTEETRVKVIYDDDNWYFGIEAMTEHPWGPLRANVRSRDGNVWEDDCVEIFIVPPGGDYYHLIINSLGTLYDAQVRAVAFDSAAEISVQVLQDRYRIEMRVPVAPMGVESVIPSQNWQMHFFRCCRNLQPPNSTEGSGLDATPPHEQTLFRRVSLGTPVVNNGTFSTLAPKQENSKGILTDEFPKGWGANQGSLIRGANNQNSVEITDLLYTYINIPKSDKPTKISGVLYASGKGKIHISLRGCIQPPDDPKPFRYDTTREIGTIELTEKVTAHPLTFEIEPYGVFVIDFRCKGPGAKAIIESIQLSR